jgi:hypothetical protein
MSLQSAIIANNMLAGKEHIGYMGGYAVDRRDDEADIADLRLVANLGLENDQCNAFLVRKDAPQQFSSDQEAIQWLDGNTVAVPKGRGKRWWLSRNARGVDQAAARRRKTLSAGGTRRPRALLLLTSARARFVSRADRQNYRALPKNASSL